MLRDKMPVFQDRSHAGEVLADLLKDYSHDKLSLVAIPNGGVPVALSIFKNFRELNQNVELQLLVVRKIPIPFNTEAGFGAITFDGTIILNQPLVARLGLTEDQIQHQASEVMQDMKRRLKFYDIETQKFEMKDKVVILIDDGLASGFTMIAAIKSIRKYDPRKIIVAVPTAPRSSVERVSPLVDAVICPNIRDTLYFAVADAYKNWYDLDAEEVRTILKEIRTKDRQ
jgi:putative phosphoribosyl transferase